MVADRTQRGVLAGSYRPGRSTISRSPGGAAARRRSVQFSVLGSLQVLSRGVDLAPSAPKLREVLALLVLRNNHVVQTSELIDELWGERPPMSALSTLQTYVYKLRRLLAAERAPGEEMLTTRPSGYRLDADPDDLDFHRFERLIDAGRNALEAGRSELASSALGQALTLWRGPALFDVETGSLLSAQAIRLEERRLHALELRLDADLALGRHQDLVGELKALASSHPLQEGFHAKLMLVLHRSGRRHDALDVYRRLRAVLADEL